MQNTQIDVQRANTSKYPMTPTKLTSILMIADEGFAEEWGTTTHPAHIVLELNKIYMKHMAITEDLWDNDNATDFIEEVESHPKLVNYMNNVALQNADFVYDCLCGSGL